jgi:hypothetical protein
MGLSDNERLCGIYRIIDQVYELMREWELNCAHPDSGWNAASPFLGLCKQLWPAFLGRGRNPLHWLMGSDSDQTLTDQPTTPWAVAVQRHLEEAYETIVEDRQYTATGYRKFKFEPVGDRFAIPSLLNWGNRADLALIFRIYQKMEDLIYRLRRYDDAFLERFSTLNDLVSTIMGACHHQFQEEKQFAQAYVLRQFASKLYGDTNTDDLVSSIVTQFVEFSRIKKLMGQPLGNLIKMLMPLLHAEAQGAEKLLHARMLAAAAHVDVQHYAEVRKLIKDSILKPHWTEYKAIIKGRSEPVPQDENDWFREIEAFGWHACRDLRKLLEHEEKSDE